MTDISRRNLLTLKQTFAPPDSGPEVMRKRYFPNVPLVTHEGKRVRFYDDVVKGKIVLLNLMYADCTASCPLITANLLKAQKILNRSDVFFKAPVNSAGRLPRERDSRALFRMLICRRTRPSRTAISTKRARCRRS